MKKSMYLFIIGLILTASNFVVFGDNCGLEHQIQQELKDKMAAFGKKYKKDPMVQAILKKDLKKIKKLSIKPRTKLEAKVVYNAYHYQSITKCNYIGLAIQNFFKTAYCGPLATLDQNEHNRKKYAPKIKAFLKKEADHLYSVINELIKKDVNTKSVHMSDSYFYDKGKWRFVPYLQQRDQGFVKYFTEAYKNKQLDSMFSI